MGEDAWLEVQHQADAGVGSVLKWVWGSMEEAVLPEAGSPSDAIPRKRDIPMNYRMAKALVFAKVRTSLGLDNCHAFFSSASPLSQDVSEFFLSLDIPIGEIYGMSECSGPHTVSNKSVYRVLRYQASAALSG